MLTVAVAALTALVVVIGLAATGAAPRALAQAPTATYMSVKDGDVLREPAFVLQMCFAQPINVRDKGKGGDFDFSLVEPDRIGLGMWIVFQPDGNGVAIYPGTAPGQTDGEWTFTWRVTNPATLEPAEGAVKFTVDPGGQPVPTSTPRGCLAGGIPGPTDAPTSGPTTSPSPTGQVPAASGGVGGGAPEQTGGPTGRLGPTPTAGGGGGDEGSGPDILLLSMLTIGAAGGAALLALIGYLVRKRIGYSPHRPPPRDGAGGPEHD